MASVYLGDVSANPYTSDSFEACFNRVEKERFELKKSLFGDEEINKEYQNARREYGMLLWHASSLVITAFQRKDLDALISLMSFPLITGPRKERFEQETFDQLFTSDMISKVASAQPTCSSYVDKGGMIANGMVWVDAGINTSARSENPKIISIRSTIEKFQFPVELNYSELFGNQIIHPSCLFVLTPSNDVTESIIENYRINLDPYNHELDDIFAFVSSETSQLFTPVWKEDNPNLSKWDQVALSMPLNHCLIDASELESMGAIFNGNEWRYIDENREIKGYDFRYMLTKLECDYISKSKLGVDACFIAKVSTGYRYMPEQYFVYGIMSNHTIAPLTYAASNRDGLISFIKKLR